jgi:hypothetical protein
MNQLQNLLHDALISTDHVQHCAIIRRKDCCIRASSVGFNVCNIQTKFYDISYPSTVTYSSMLNIDIPACFDTGSNIDISL